MTPKQFYFALEDWKNDQVMKREQMFYSLDPHMMSTVKKASKLFSFPWEEIEKPYVINDSDWQTLDNYCKN